MKKLIIVLAALIACGAPPKPLVLGNGAHLADGSVILGTPNHRLGVTLNDAGLPVDDGGAVSIALTANVPAALGDPAIDHCVINDISIDPPTCNFAAHVSCGPRAKTVQGQLTQAQCNAVYNLVKNAAAAGGIQ